ncbi:MAG TPA: hypothetical protein DCS07_06680 [Bdellovibrionales bacterium]|nr:MAG: hypothetical protein A2Z97_08165 [Bdellovibrionales bacterium GWB1_52_6]OFZ03823.1 MAG: hypothetical protein A2X97_15605 [Bdellovibrionales bacterium GWA1_52_35]OFZ39615.1 MAG: hypothetical protein A2070_05915 [Bdellovibrionales bacterium GWC1_52_8]HAR42303.1 hypothetical protein [Bdellovibrionales bacterium]HCM39742.1 hypothetical protein [Bdellovibrionales bacterium]
MSEFFMFVRGSFWHAAPIMVGGGFAVAIIIERVRTLFKVYPMQDIDGFFDRITGMVISGKVSEAIGLCDQYRGKPSADVTKQALLRAHQPEDLVESGIGLVVGKLTQAIQRRTSFLATIANVSTLLGLFGTIAGLIYSFEAIGQADPQQKSTLLAVGISQAMNATMLGLAVAIPCMIAFSLLVNRSNRLVAEVDSSAMRAMDVLRQRYYTVELEAQNSASIYSEPTAPAREKRKPKSKALEEAVVRL